MSDKPKARDDAAASHSPSDPSLDPAALGWPAGPFNPMAVLETAACHSLAILFTQAVQQQAMTALIGQQAQQRQLQQLEGQAGLAATLALGRLAEAAGGPAGPAGA